MQNNTCTITKSEAFVLETLLKDKHILAGNGITVKELSLKTGISQITTYKILNNQVKVENIKEGIKKRNAKTYYITSEGAKLYVSLYALDPNTKKSLAESYVNLTDAPDKEELEWDNLVNEALNHR